jgi:choline kinase
MRAVILAGGLGSRLRAAVPKSMMELDGRPLLHWQLDVLREAGIKDVAVVVGHRADEVDTLDALRIRNPRPSDTNMVESLACASEWILGMPGPTIVSYGDIVFEGRILGPLLDSCRADIGVIIDMEWHRLWSARFADPLVDAETLLLSGDTITDIGRRPKSLDEIAGQYIGLTRFTRAGFQRLLEMRSRDVELGQWNERIHMTEALRLLIKDGAVVQGIRVQGGWLEVDTAADLALYGDVILGARLPGWIQWPPSGCSPAAGRPL